ncbi:MAG: LysR family transcriptional regulator [Bdellovibrionaceae bacterium]|nr:LysR family transcriptional regulator [Pseudobdellovibrionaceae bacterium]
MLQTLAYELSVLAKAIQHKNLSAAAVHVGLSQPQLSRLVAKIESELNVVLLDRTARRKSGWTPMALELSLIFTRGLGRLEGEIMALAEERDITELRIGSLEGLSGISTQFAKSCFDQLGMKLVYLDLLDFRDLDSQFLSGNLDLIFTVKSPSKQKYQKMIEVGFQQMEKVNSDPKTLICSPFEFAGLEKREVEAASHLLVSNSLSLRSQWLHNFGGAGTLPVDAKKGRGKGHYSIYLIGSDILSPRIWDRLKTLF